MSSLLRIPLAALLLTAALFGRSAFADNSIRPVPSGAAFRAATVDVRVVPDRPDWTYQVGDSVSFTVVVTADNVPLNDVAIEYAVGPELMPTTIRTATVPASGLTIDGGTLREPGFIRCAVGARFGDRSYKGAATAAFSPEKIRPTQHEPKDFDEFWKAGKSELAQIPIEPRMTLLPEQSSGAVNVYQVSFRTIGPPWTSVPARIYGILCEPKAPGKYPAILRVPGAGIRPYSGDRRFAERGAITLEIGIHGIPVTLPQEVYDQLAAGAMNDYWTFNLDDPKAYYYRRVYLGCVRAVDFLARHGSWDGRNLIVSGASQGGQLAIATAALDERVTALTATHPAYCDVTGPLHGRAGGWPHPFRIYQAGGEAPHATPAKIRTTGYYDTVNFARRLKVPGFYTWGYNDEVTPPTSVYAAYNVIRAPKELALMLEIGHQYPPEQYEIISRWIAQRLGLE